MLRSRASTAASAPADTGSAPLLRLLGEDGVLLDWSVTSKKRLFEQVGIHLENRLGLGRAQVYDALFKRERLGSTGLGQGVAIPHGRIKGLKDAVGLLIRLEHPLPFEAPDGLPVQLIFVLLVPHQATDIHLELLSLLAQMFSHRGLREAMQVAPDADSIRSMIREWQPYAADYRPEAV